MIKKFLPAIFLLTVAFFASARAQTAVVPEKQAAIRELVKLMNGDNNVEEMMRAMAPKMQEQKDMILQASLDALSDLSPAEKKAIVEAVNADSRYSSERYLNRLMQKLDYTALLAEISFSVYDKHFTLAEINDLIAFYKTPTGQKFVRSMTPIMTDTMNAVQERVVPKMLVVIKELMDEDKADIERQINAKKPRPKNNGTD